MTNRPLSSVTTILAYLVGSSVVSAITQTPASGPCAPVTVPPISLAPTETAPCSALHTGELMPSQGAANPNVAAGSLKHPTRTKPFLIAAPSLAAVHEAG